MNGAAIWEHRNVKGSKQMEKTRVWRSTKLLMGRWPFSPFLVSPGLDLKDSETWKYTPGVNRNNSKRSSFSGLKSRKGDQLRVREGGRNLGGFSFLFPLPCPSTQAVLHWWQQWHSNDYSGGGGGGPQKPEEDNHFV